MLTGYAAKFDSYSEDLGGFIEVIRPGAFTRTLAEGADVRCLFNHDENLILGRTKSKTLRLTEDATGLYFECDVPDSNTGRSVYEAVQRGDVDQCSFGFCCVDEHFAPNPSGQPAVVRELLDVDIFDVSVVTYPAYGSTSVSARSLWPKGQPEYLEVRNLARTLRNHSRASIEEAAGRTEQAENRRKLDEITADDRRAQERIESERRRIALF